jgi:hypothetical protein
MLGLLTRSSNAQLTWISISQDQEEYVDAEYIPELFTLWEPSHMWVQEKQQLLDFWRAWQENARIKHVFLWKAYSTLDGMVKYNYVEKDLPKETRSSWKAKSKGQKQNGVNSKTSKGKGKAKAITPPISEEELDDNDDQGLSAKDSDIAVTPQLVS